MKLMLEFDCSADLIDVPQHVIDDRELHRRRFLKWLYDKNNKHKYWVKIRDRDRSCYQGVSYRSDAFVEWLNKKVLKNEVEKAAILQQDVSIDDCDSALPRIFF